MKEQLLKWGFENQIGSDWYELRRDDNTTIILRSINDNLSSVCMFINEHRVYVPNCTTKLALFAFLYNLGLIEI